MVVRTTVDPPPTFASKPSSTSSVLRHDVGQEPRTAGDASPTRTVHCAEAWSWLAENSVPPTTAFFTSLPDSTELPRQSFPQWKDWFVESTRRICERCPPQQVSIFFQTDVKRNGVWVDKSYLCQRGAELAGVELLWHKVVCRAPAGVTTFGRPAYAHLLCFSKELRIPPAHSTPDVIPTLGSMTWSRAVGLDACRAAMSFLRRHTSADTVIDPFCGEGTVLAVANEFGLNALGVDLSAKRVRKAAVLRFADRRANAKHPESLG